MLIRDEAASEPSGIVMSREVVRARTAGTPVVVLESTIISHGLPQPRNLEVAMELESLVRQGGACPATIAVLDGLVRVGLDESELRRVATEPGFRKLGLRDLAPALASKVSGATTVSATSYLAARAGLRVFATGGLGGVHRGWVSSRDESADLEVLAGTPLTVVCAGVKSILDVPATLQRLETLNVTVLGYRTSEFPGFYLHSSGEPLDWRVDDPAGVVAVMRRRDELQTSSALIVANPVAVEHQLDPLLHDAVLAEALSAAERENVRGQALTPFLLDAMVRGTNGASLEANLEAVRSNVRLGTAVAREMQV